MPLSYYFYKFAPIHTDINLNPIPQKMFMQGRWIFDEIPQVEEGV